MATTAAQLRAALESLRAHGIEMVMQDPTAPAVGAPVSQPPAASGALTQADVDRIIGQRIAEEKAKQEQQIAQMLGMSPADAKKKLDDAEAARRAGLDEAERAKLEAADALASANSTKAEADQKLLEARVTVALVSANVPATQSARVAKMVMAELEAGASDDQVKAAVEHLKRDVPQLFGPAAAAAPPAGAGAAPPTGSAAGADPFQKGMERAKALGVSHYGFEAKPAG